MKSIVKLIIAAAVISWTALASGQSTLAKWTFEVSVPGGATGITSTAISGILPEIGTGTASGLHASAASVWSNPAGNGSVESLSVNNWAVGDYFQFQTSTLGFSGIGVSFDQTSSGTGPGLFNLAYSTDGSIFTAIGPAYAVLPNAAPNPVWNSATASPLYTKTYDLSLITALDNVAAVYFRLINSSTISANGGTVAAGGTDRVDNFHVYAPVPEPSTLTLVLAGGLGLVGLLRRRR